VKLVLDTNILISALINKKGPPGSLYEQWGQKYQLITSEFQIEELTRIISYPKLTKLIQPNDSDTLLIRLYSKAIIVSQLQDINDSPDPDDNKIIATAIAGEANYLVSGDKAHLLLLQQVQNIQIVSASHMLSILTAEK
jgi:putative PIN family toxin of toxin-antitoxin system